jgi:hypothetical protein
MTLSGGIGISGNDGNLLFIAYLIPYSSAV